MDSTLTNAPTKLRRSFLLVLTVYLLAGMHYFQHNQGGSGLELPINLVAWVFISTLIGLGLWQISLNRKVYFPPALIAVSVMTLCLWIPMLYPNNQFASLALPRLLALSAGVLMLLAFFQFRFERRHINIICYLILVAVIIEAAYGFSQRYFFEIGNWMGFNTTGYRRPYAIFQQPNPASSFFLFGPLISAYLICTNSKLKNWQLALITISSAAAGWMVMQNASRTSTIAYAISLVLMAPWLYQRARKAYLQTWLVACLLGVLVPYLAAILISGEAIEVAKSVSIRETIYFTCLLMIAAKPLLGWGYGGFDSHYHHQQLLYNQQGIINDFQPNMAHPHNELFLWGVEGGLLPVIAIVGFSLYLTKVMFSRGWKRGSFYFGLLFPILFHCMTEYPFYHAAVLWLLFLFVVFLVLHDTQALKSQNVLYDFALRCFAILIPILTSAFMLTGLKTVDLIVKYERNPEASVVLLEQIVNPFPMLTKVEYNSMTYRLRAGLVLGLDDELEAYVEWSKEKIANFPRPELYHNLSLAYQQLGQIQLSDNIRQQGRELFPKSSLLQAELPQSSATSSSSDTSQSQGIGLSEGKPTLSTASSS
ncbi:hypothetical protein DBZ36_16880 [Alginatibacterium sediminis]|uniref:Uncharacterized protein n=1 Tax=Alginatibacterium sediminis TaxID=2164068 RepID=A0A420E837_9ALTE|nr:PglL family O-oligosaccharyltransferase [Alginatibacterium sediminis]RKF14333.1 hypothetical protein DBZ36_16880 [Alginatibacterium sediminis]